MKYLLALILAVSAAAQTKINPTNLAEVPQGGRILIIKANNEVGWAKLDSTVDVVLNPDGTYTLKAQPPSQQGQQLVDAEDTLDAVAGTSNIFTLTADPAPVSLWIQRNGQVLREGRDYTRAGRVITFTAAQHTPKIGDSYVFRYRK